MPKIEPKNVLLIIADQFRPDCIAAAGNPIIRTPNLDALARDGVMFRQCFAQTAPCGPSRMCLYTSKYLCATRSVNNYTPLADADDNVARYLRDAGIHTAIFGYNDYAVDPRILPDDDPRKSGLSYENFLPGFETIFKHEYHSPEYFAYLREKGYLEKWCGPDICVAYNVPTEGTGGHLALRFPAHCKAEDSEAAFLTEKARDFLRQRAGDGWFLSLNYIKPHPPRICPAPYNDMYDPAVMPPATRRPEELDNPHPYLKIARHEPAVEDDLELRETQACYYGMITEIDTCIGRVIDELKATGQWDSTMVIFTSDHGEYLGDHYLLDKCHFYDATMHVPLIIRDPSSDADETRGQFMGGFCESIDIAPTILGFLDVPKPDTFQGSSMLGRIRGNPFAPAKTEIHYEYDFRGRHTGLAMENPDACLLWVVRDNAFKYVQFGLESMPPLLFDLQNDPGEFVNLADCPEFAPVVVEYCQRLLRWRMRNEDQRMEHWAAQYRA